MEAGATQTVIFIIVMIGAVMMLAAGIWAYRSRMGTKEISVEARRDLSSSGATFGGRKSSASVRSFSLSTSSGEKRWSSRQLTGEEGPEILALLESGNKLQAIKRLREITGMELSAANEFIEKISNLGGFSNFPGDDDVMLDPSNNDDIGLTENQLAEVASLMRSNQKIQAIKLVREWSGMGLAESKDWVEAFEDGSARRTIH